MKTFEQSFADIDRMAQTEQKPVMAMLAKLGEEFGETCEALLIHEGHITHKTLKEPVMGEIADVCQVAISLLVRVTPNMTTKQRLAVFLTFLEAKNAKWAQVQAGELRRAEGITPEELETGMPFEKEIRAARIARPHPFLEPVYDDANYFDPAADYTDKTGRNLTLAERMQERSRVLNQRPHDGLHEEF